MARIVFTAEVDDPEQWEKGFRTHTDSFRRQAIRSPMSYTVTADGEVAIFAETDDLEQFMKIMESQATADAMFKDGVRRETVKVYVLDKELAL